MRKNRNESSQPTNSNNLEDSRSGFLNVVEIAGCLGLKTSTVYTMVEERQIPHYRIRRQIRFKPSEIEEWLEERKEPVIDTGAQAKKVIRSIAKKADLDVDRIVKKAIEWVKEKQYTSPQEKPGRIKGLGKEVDDGTI